MPPLNHFFRKAALGLVVSVLSTTLSRAQETPTPSQVEFFEKKIRPVLAEACYECHNSIDKDKGGVALDWREALIDSDVIVPGDPDASVLMATIRHEEDFEPMPWKKPKLSNLTIANFEKWIRMGAPDPRTEKPSKEDLERQVDWTAVRDDRASWWSFQPIKDPKAPVASDPDWNRTEIDRFVFAGLEEAGLSPQAPARPEVLVRRLHLVLTGLPPTPEVVKAYTANPTEEAYGKLVDSLLESTAYGERWGRYWLDWFRYAESHGSEGDPAVPYPEVYRDYVIRALNEDVPYDQLLKEAVAGDLLENPRVNEELGLNESAIGPGHFRMVPHGFGVTDAYDEQITFTDNQVDVLTKATMGMTLSCARCHNHKFDPLSQADFYKFYGMMISSRPGVINVDSPANQERHRDALAAMKPAIQEGVADYWLGAVAVAIDRLEKQNRKDLDKGVATDEGNPIHAWVRFGNQKDEVISREWTGLNQRHQDRVAEKAARIESATFYADLRDQPTYDRWFRNGTGLGETVSPAGVFAVAGEGEEALTGVYPRGIYTHLLTDKDNATLGSIFHLAEGRSAQIRAVGANATCRLTIRSYPLMHGGLHPAPALSDAFQWVGQKKYSYWNGEKVYFQLQTGPDQTFRPGKGRAWFGVTEVYGGEEPMPRIGAPIVSLPGDLPEVNSSEDLLAVYRSGLEAALLSWKQGKPTDAQAELIEAFRRHGLLPNRLAEFPAPLREKIEAYRALEAEIREPVRAPGVIEGEVWDQPMLVQGNYSDEEEPVARGFLEVFGGRPYPKSGSGRRELAEDLVGEDNTLVARVMVNRLWHHVFGKGLVTSTDNFGRLGKPPSHPELLDHLASRFRTEDGWSLKQTLRRLVTSRTFVSGSVTSEAASESDPENRLLSHYPPRRLDAEAIKDTIGFVSGALGQRAVYTRQKRNSLDPFLAAFNLPIPTTTVGVRDSTNVPAQSLMLLNSSVAHQAARRWRDQLLNDRALQTDEARITRLFEQAYSRPPTSDELATCLEFLEAKSDDAAIERLSDLLEAAETTLASLEANREILLEPVRSRLEKEVAARNEAAKKKAGSVAVDLKPIGQWDFESNLKNSVGDQDGRLLGKARLESGALVLEGGCLITDPIGKNLQAKTLEVLVQLDNLDQRAGGAMTVQTLDGVIFDGIVYAEIGNREWLTGSNNHKRTQPFGGAPETDAGRRPVRMILVYEEDGTTRAYRDGKPYGKAIRKAAGQAFEGGNAQVVFGLRHGTGPGGNRMLTGRVYEARLYDRALTPQEVAAASSGEWQEVVTREKLYTALDPPIRGQVDALDGKIDAASAEVQKLGRQLESEQQVRGNLADGYSRLAHAILNSKELIYVY